MRRKSAALALYLAALLASPSPAAVLRNFETPGEALVFKGAERGGSCQYAAAPEPLGKQSLKVSWENRHAPWLDIGVLPPTPLPDASEKVGGTLSVSVYSGGAPEVTEINARLVDAKGETFQWKKKVDLSAKGWQELAYTITATNFNDSWGTTKTGQIALPLKFFGFAISFSAESTPAGSIYFDNISFSTGGAMVPYSETVYLFNDTEKWGSNVRGASCGMTTSDAGLRVIWTAQKPAQTLILTERKSSLTDIGSPSRIVLKLTSATTAAQAAVALKDSKGVSFLLKPKEVKAGENELAWALPAEIATSWGGEGKNPTVNFPVTVSELRLISPTPAAPVDVVLHSLRAGGVMPELNALRVNVETGNPLHLVTPGNEKQLALGIDNIACVPVEFSIDLKLRDFFGTAVSMRNSFVIDAGRHLQWKLPTIPTAQGIWWVDYTLKDRTATSKVTGSRSFCLMEPAGPTPLRKSGRSSWSALFGGGARDNSEFVWGMNTHTERWSRRDQELEVLAMSLCGVKAARTGVEWAGVQPDADTWNWEEMDRLVDMYEQVGIVVQPLLGFCPQWAAPPEKRKSTNWLEWSRSAPDTAAFGRYAEELTKRYRGRIDTIEVWNEPDIGFFNGTQDDYLTMLKTAYAAVKKTAPEIQVMTGGFATLGYHPSTKKDFHKNVVALGQDYFDIHATHEHGSADDYAKIVDGPLAEVRAQLKSPKPWYANETAICSMNGEEFQAETLVKKIVFTMARGGIGYNWYDLRNDGFNSKDAEHTYGIITNDFYPKAAYPAFNNLTRILRGKKFVTQLDAGAATTVFLFKDDAESALVAWSNDRKGSDSLLLVRNAAAGTRAVDLMGNAEAAPALAGKALFKVSPIPRYLVTPNSGTDDIALERSLISLEAAPVGCPGQQLAIKGSIFNPFEKDSLFRTALVLPATVLCHEPTKSLSVPAHASVPFSFTASIPATYEGTGGDGARIFCEMEGSSHWGGAISFPLPIAQKIPPGDMASRKADFILDTHASVVNFSEKDPNLAHLAWTGPKDLSGAITLGRKPGALLVRVDATDDTHFQEDSGPNVWRGDCVQMGIKIPGQQGFWEFGLSMLKDGKAEVFCWSRPTGFDDPVKKVTLTTTPTDGKLLHAAEFPYDALGLSDAILESGLRFNLIVNDNDGKGRKGWVQIAPGIGQGKDPEQFPYIVFGKP